MASLIPRHSLRGVIRKVWWWSPQRKEALKRAKGSLGFYVCETCRCPTKKPEVDHLVAVGPTPGAKGSGATTWDEMIARMFCAADGLRVLCKDCHAARTAEQRKGGAA